MQANRRTTRTTLQTASPTLVALGLSFGTALWAPAAALAQNTGGAAPAELEFHIPAGPLAPALRQAAAHANVLLTFTTEQTAGRSSPGLNGRYAPTEAFSRLLEGSGLQATQLPNGAYILRTQPAPAPAQAHSQESSALPSVLVTAARETPNALRLREPVASGALGSRSQLDTPFSTSVVTSTDIQERQVSSLGQAFALDASVASPVSPYYWRPSDLYVRGLAFDTINSTKFNGTPLNLQGIEMPYELLDKVELLKGVSAFMYGFASPGGTLNFVSRKPTEEPVRSVSVGVKSGNVWSETLDLGGRAGADGMFGYRLGASHEEGTTYDKGRIQRDAFSLGLDARLTPDLTWNLETLYQKRRTLGGTNSIVLIDGAALPAPLKDARNLSADGVFNNTEFKLLSTGLQYRVSPDWKFSVSGSYSEASRRFVENDLFVNDAQGNYPSGAVYDSAGRYRFSQWQAVAEGKLTTGPFAHQLTMGLSRQDGVSRYLPDNIYADFGSGNIYQPSRNAYLSPFTSIHLVKDSNYVQTAAFASDTVKLSEAWSVLLGMRHTRYEQNNYDGTGAVTASYRKTPNTPVLALLYKPVPHATLYGSYVESLEQGGTVASIYENRGTLLPPLISKQYEIGAKVDADRWAATAALFRIQRGAEYVNSANYYVQDGMSLYQGLEMAGSYRADGGLVLGGSMMWLDAKYKDTAAGDALNGHRPAGAPKFVAAIYANYSIPQVPGLSIGANLRYSSDVVAYYYSGSSAIHLPSYTVVDLQASYKTRIGSNAVTWTAAVNNVANRHYWYGNQLATVGAPRTFMLNAKLSF